MKWENLTADQLREAVKQSNRTVVLPVSITEKHGHHLPLGTDTFINRLILNRAEELLPSMVVEEELFDPLDETQVDLSGIVNAKENTDE